MTETRPANPGDLTAVAALIARLNADPTTQSLHCVDRTGIALRRTLSNPMEFPGGWHRSFVVTVDSHGSVMAVFGCQFNPEQEIGWLWGPWLDSELPGSSFGAALLDALSGILPRTARRIDAFLHVENRSALRLLEAHGFRPGPATYLYTAFRKDWRRPDRSTLFPALRTAHEIGFARLHGETFPTQAAAPAEALLNGRDDEHAVFAATDGLRLLGSVCVSINHAPVEGFIDYLAVKPIARGRGIGSRLLSTALDWTFETKQLPQTTLCVSHWRDDARRLYEKNGFVPQAVGIAVRRYL